MSDDYVGTLSQEAIDFAIGGALTLPAGTWLVESSLEGHGILLTGEGTVATASEPAGAEQGDAP